jgi:hypothetical protein
MGIEVMMRYSLIGLGAIVMVVMILFFIFGRQQHNPGNKEIKKQ